MCQNTVSEQQRRPLRYRAKTDFRGPKMPPIEHRTCSTICGTPVQAIWDHKDLTELAGGVREGQNLPQNGLNLALEPSRGP